MSTRRAPSVLESFNYAFEGIIHVLRTQRNMRLHFALAFLVLVLALVVIGEILKEVEGIEFVRFGGEDVVRHKLVQRIVAAYNEYAEKQAPPLRQAQARRQQS